VSPGVVQQIGVIGPDDRTPVGWCAGRRAYRPVSPAWMRLGNGMDDPRHRLGLLPHAERVEDRILVAVVVLGECLGARALPAGCPAPGDHGRVRITSLAAVGVTSRAGGKPVGAGRPCPPLVGLQPVHRRHADTHSRRDSQVRTLHRAIVQPGLFGLVDLPNPLGSTCRQLRGANPEPTVWMRLSTGLRWSRWTRGHPGPWRSRLRGPRRTCVDTWARSGWIPPCQRGLISLPGRPPGCTGDRDRPTTEADSTP
jgi:hypothetical protein